LVKASFRERKLTNFSEFIAMASHFPVTFSQASSLPRGLAEIKLPMRLTGLLIVLLSQFFIPGNCQSPLDSIMRKSMSEFMESPESVGGSIGIVIEGKKYTFNMGEKTKGKHDLPGANTVYCIGSITKTFTGTLLAFAVLDHKIKLDDDIRKYLDGDYSNLEYKGHYITVAQLLNHRSGLPYMIPYSPLYGSASNEQLVHHLDSLYRNYTKADFFSDLRKVQLDFVPGEQFRYSNTGAQLCGYIIEKLYRKTYDQLLAEQLTKRLGMHSTGIVISATKKNLMPSGYNDKGVVMPIIPNQLEGAGALKASVADMLNYAQWHLDGSNAAAKLSHEPTWQNGNYWAGLNWQVIKNGNTRLIWQSGNVAGFTSYCVLYPESKMAIVVLTNEEDRTAPGRIEKMINQVAHAINSNAPALP